VTNRPTVARTRPDSPEGDSMTAQTIASPAPQRAPWPVRLGLMVTALTLLVSQISLTRLMSVTVNYHSAFLILAVVMLGMATSAVSVFVGLRRKERPVTVADSVGAAYKSAAAAFVALVGFVVVVARDWGAWSRPFQLVLAAVLFFGWFFYSGYVVALLLSHYARDMARLYWFDLVGAAGGCLLVVPLLDHLPAPNVVLLCAAGMAVAGTFLALPLGGPSARRRGLVLSLVFLLMWGLTAAEPWLLRLRFAKGQDQSQVVWERWNALARVSVSREIPGTSEAIELYQRSQGVRLTPEEIEAARRRFQAGWSLSREFQGSALPSLWVQLDSDAGTPILQDGVARLDQPGQLDALGWDVTTLAYSARASAGTTGGEVFIVGGGGGRDVLAALSCGAAAVDVVELNPAVVEAVERVFSDYSGRVYSHPKVRLTVGEARNELSRRAQQYDVIQMSLIDTWASSMAGSMVMTENGLYTQEAFDLYLARLKPDGVLSLTRWYHPVRYGETARAAVLLASTLRRAGVERPEEHVAVALSHGSLDTAAATLLMKRSPFTPQERDGLGRLCRERGYRLLWPRLDGVDGEAAFDLGALLRLDARALDDPHFDLSPPTDDRPFFFNVDRPLASWVDAVQSGDLGRGSRATLVLGVTLLGMSFACYRLVVRPLRSSRSGGNGASPRSTFLAPLLYFGGIGLGFMLVELALIQRYILFLGHPSYAISVVLFALLLFGGCGSYLTGGIDESRLARTTRLALAMVLGGTLLTALVVPGWLARAESWAWPARLGIAVGLIAPVALFMGMIFPLGVRRLAAAGQEEMVPWMWGVNGICGVIALVLGMLLAMNLSYTAVLLFGTAAYGVTLLSLALPSAVEASPQVGAGPCAATTAVETAVH
jgi:SAM-dependent methyltransferase